MESINSNDEKKPARYVTDEHSDSETSEAAAPGAAKGYTEPKQTALQKLAGNWMALAGIFTVLLFAGLFLWVRSAKEAAMQEDEPVAAASANIEEQIPAAQSAPAPVQVTPLEQIEAQRAEKARAQYAQPVESAAAVADVFAVDTAGTARRRKQRNLLAAARRAEAARQAADVDTIETTAQDPVTGAYRAHSVVVPRNRTASYGGAGRGGRGAGASLLPARDVDGVPFETDPEVLAMLSTSAPETRLQYEKMTGKRYRDPAVAAQMIAQRGGANNVDGGNGMVYDGFNTVKVGNASRMMTQGQQQQQQLTPDVFYQCVINGPQKVRTGSVVIMRLVEDAVISGVTFPKNMIFAAVANVGTNNITLRVDRLAATRVGAEIFDFNYMPGIMIDPKKRIPRTDDAGTQLRQSATTEVTTAIDRSASAANSVTGVAGRLLTTMIGRSPSTTKLRDVMLPDGYPILITTAAAGQLGPQASGMMSR